MSWKLASPALVAALVQEVLIPAECGDIEILIPVDGAVMLSYRVFVRNVDLRKLGRAFSAAGAEGSEGSLDPEEPKKF